MFYNRNFMNTGISCHILKPVNWIVSYPRSGNTFLRCLLANYAADSSKPLTLEQIARSSCGEHDETIYFELTGKRPAERTLIEELRARPAYFGRIRQLTDPRLPMIKSHTVHGEVEAFPTYKFAPGDRVVHLVRHPCDVAISVAHYYNLDIDVAIDQVLREGTYYNGWPNVGYEVIGSWSQHTRDWMEATDVPVFRTRYADLVTRTAEVLTALVEFLGMPLEQTRVERAVEFSRFSRLQAEERKGGYVETADTAKDGYFREGRPGQWLDRLTIKQAQRILDHDPELIDTLEFQKVVLSRV